MGVPFPFAETDPEPTLSVREWRATRKRQRMAGLVAALVLEALVVLALLTLGARRMAEMDGGDRPLTTFDLAAPAPEPEIEIAAKPEQKAETRPVEPTPPTPDTPRPVEAPAPIAEAPETPRPEPLVKLSPSDMAAADLRSLPSSPARPPARSGPPAPSASASDTPLVDGSGPNGEKLYAAAWQREPYDSEVRGYLSTAQPGWGIIACRTVPDFRVDDCVAVGESRGSQLTRAMLAAAWQFRVRPPRIGGQLQVGEWVRIRFDYRVDRKPSWQ